MLQRSMLLRFCVVASVLLGLSSVCAAESNMTGTLNQNGKNRSSFDKVYQEINRIDLLVKGNARYVDLTEEIHREEVARMQRDANRAMLDEVTQRTQELDTVQKSVDVTALQLKNKQQQLGNKSLRLSGDVKEGVAQNENLKLLMSLYESVKPDEAAELLKRLPLPVAVTMMETMSPRKASKILSAMDPKFAADVSRRIIHGGETVAKAAEAPAAAASRPAEASAAAGNVPAPAIANAANTTNATAATAPPVPAAPAGAATTGENP